MISEEALQEKKKALEGGLAVDIRGGSTRSMSAARLSARVSPVRRTHQASGPDTLTFTLPLRSKLYH